MKKLFAIILMFMCSQSFADFPGTVAGTITDAVSGWGIPGAIVRIGDLIIQTDQYGRYRLENVSSDEVYVDFVATPDTGFTPLLVQFADRSLPGQQRIEIEHEDYITFNSSVAVLSGGERIFNAQLTPIDSTLAFSLQLFWQQQPADLDLHALLATERDTFDVFWNNPGHPALLPFALHKGDDVDGFGPEIIDVFKTTDGDYTIFVRNNSSTIGFDESEARLDIVFDDSTFSVTAPTSGQGAYWHVLKMNPHNNEFSILNVLSDNPPAGAASSLLQKSVPEIPVEIPSISGWIWDFNNDGVFDSDARNPIHEYTEAGLQSVTLRVTTLDTFFQYTKYDFVNVFYKDFTPPETVTDLQAELEGVATATLSWQNPSDSDLEKIIIRKSVKAFPQDTTDGVLVYSGLDTAVIDANLVPGNSYYYAAFSVDTSGLYATPNADAQTLLDVPPLTALRGLSAEIVSIDALHFPDIVFQTVIKDSASATLLDSIQVDNVFILENENVVNDVVEISRDDYSPQYDVVFITNTQAGMQDDLSMFVPQLSTFLTQMELDGFDLTFAGVSFADQVQTVYPFTENRQQFTSDFLDHLQVNAAQSEKSNLLNALDAANRLNFRPGAQPLYFILTDNDYYRVHNESAFTFFKTSDFKPFKSPFIFSWGPQDVDLTFIQTDFSSFSIDDNFSLSFFHISQIFENLHFYTFRSSNTQAGWRNLQFTCWQDSLAGTGSTAYFYSDVEPDLNAEVYAISPTALVSYWSAPKDSGMQVVVLKSENEPVAQWQDAEQVYAGRAQKLVLTDLNPESDYYLSFLACGSGGAGADDGLLQTLHITMPSEQPEMLWREKVNIAAALTAVTTSLDGNVWLAGTDSKLYLYSDLGDLQSFLFQDNVEFYDIVSVENDIVIAVGVDENGNAVLARSSNNGQSWTFPQIDVSQSLNAICMATSQVGYVGGDRGTILKTKDGGISWYPLFVESNANFKDLYFDDSETGWAVGSNGEVLKTVDGGSFWYMALDGDDAFFALDFNDAHNGWIAAQNGNLYKTENGGHTWLEPMFGDANVSDFAVFADYILVSDVDGNIYTHSDSLTNWEQKNILANSALTDLHFKSPTQGWAVSENGRLLQISKANGAAEFADADFIISKIAQSDYAKNFAIGALVDTLSHTPIADLSKAIWTLTQDGTQPSGIDIQSIEEYADAKIDFVFAIHKAAQHATLLASLQEKFTGFTRALKAQNIDARFNLVTFDQNVNAMQEWESPEQFASSLAAVRADAANEQGHVLDALAFAEKLHFRPQAQAFVLLVSDSSFPQAQGSADLTAYTLDSIIDLYHQSDISILTFDSAAQDYSYLARQTRGKVYSSNDSSSVYTNFVNDLAAQIVFTFQSTNPVLDGAEHYVQIDAAIDDYTWSDSQQYVAYPLPEPVTLDVALLKEDAVQCSWRFSDSTTAFVTLVKNDLMAPQTPNDGIVLYTGSSHSFVDTTASAGNAAHYAVFPANRNGLYGEPAAAFFATTDPDFLTWMPMQGPQPLDSLAAIAIIDSSLLVVATPAGRIFSSRTAGAAWQLLYENTAAHFTDIDFVDADNGWAVGKRTDGAPLILHTINGGSSWNNQPGFTSGAVTDVFMLDSHVGWTCGMDGQIQKTTDAGQTWLPQYTGVSKALYGVQFINYDYGWAFGADAVLLVTNNGGKTWLQQPVPTDLDIQTVDFIDTFHGFLLDAAGHIFKTENAGLFWRHMSTVADLTDIDFLSTDRGYACSSNGSIYETTDAGLHWQQNEHGADHALFDINVCNRNLGWAVGSQSSVLALADQTISEKEDLRINITQLITDDFPDMTAIVSALDSLQQPLSTLSKSDFMIHENSELQSISNLAGVQNINPQLDVVFLIDASAAATIELANSVANFYDNLSASGFDVRLGGLAFTDQILNSSSLTASLQQTQEWIGSLENQTTDSVDVITPLHRLSLFNFSPDAQKLVVLITQTQNAPIDIVPELNEITLVCAAPQTDSWRTFVDDMHAVHFSGNIVNVLNRTTALLNGQYAVFYTSTQEIPSAEKRVVQVQVNQDEMSGKDIAEYMLSAPQIYLNPAHLFSGVADRLNMHVAIANARDLFSLQFTITFDAAVFDVTHAQPGDFMNKGNVESEIQISKSEGRTTFLLSRPQGASGANGSGVVLDFELVQKSPDYDGSIRIENIDAVNSALQTLNFDSFPTTVVSASGVPIVGDFDNDRDIDLADFAKFSTFWHADATGDIGPATGTLPLLIPQSDGKVDHEDLFVFTQMWNWYHELLPENTNTTAKIASCKTDWNVESDAERLQLHLTVEQVQDLAMGRLTMQYDSQDLVFVGSQHNELLNSKDCEIALLNNDASGTLDVAFSRLASRSVQPGVTGSGALITLEFLRKNHNSTVIKTMACEFRSSRNTGINVNSPKNISVDMPALPTEYRLSQNFPNPFNPTTRIEFDLPKESIVKLEIYDLSGRLVRELVSGKKAAGRYKVEWNGTDAFHHKVASGVYFYRLKTKDFSDSHRMILLR